MRSWWGPGGRVKILSRRVWRVVVAVVMVFVVVEPGEWW